MKFNLNRSKKRFMSIFLSCCMVMGILPVYTFAGSAPVTGNLTIGGWGDGGVFVDDLTKDATGTNWSWSTTSSALTLTVSVK